MAATLGKRRRYEGGSIAAGCTNGGMCVGAREVFRRHFEAKFLPLAKEEQIEQSDNGDEVEAEAEDEIYEGEEWEGFSSEDGAVMIVEHSAVGGRSASMLDKLELKAFMVRLRSGSICLLGAYRFDSLPSLLQRNRQIGPNRRFMIHQLLWKKTKTKTRLRTSRTTSLSSASSQNLTC
jgi:hypothetical protein